MGFIRDDITEQASGDPGPGGSGWTVKAMKRTKAQRKQAKIISGQRGCHLDQGRAVARVTIEGGRVGRLQGRKGTGAPQH